MALEFAAAFDSSGATVLDLSGNGRDLDLTGSDGVQVTGGQTGNALGKTGPVMPALPGSVLAACKTDDRSIMFDARQPLVTWWVRFNDPSFGSGMWGILLLGGSMAVQARDNTGAHTLATRPTAAPPDTAGWHNYAATYVRSTGVISLYRDGALAATSSFAAGTELSTSATVLDLAEWSTTGAAIDNLRLFSHALTAAEVAALAGTPVTATGATGAGSVAPPPAAAVGAGAVLVSGSGSAAANPTSGAGEGTVPVIGASGVAAPPAVAAGAGLVVAGGVGAAVAPPAALAGTGQVRVSGGGAVVAPAAVASGGDTAAAQTPLRRMVVVPAESRFVTVPAESRFVEA